MQIGNRIIFDQDGEIICQLGEMEGDVLPRKEITKLDYVDLEYGQIDYSRYRIVRIDPETKQPILEEIPYQPTYEELQQQLLILQQQLLVAEGII